MIRFYHVGKRYGGASWALKDVSLHVRRGECLFVIGASGAGKTTLLRLIFREELPTDGQIIVNGRNVAALSRGRMPYFRRGVGVVFQDFRLLPRKTVFENIGLVLRLQGISLREQKRRVYNVLKMLNLNHRMNAFPLQLSGGEQQRIAIARALINEPPILLADEPTGNLDPELSLEIMDIFRKINAAGTTVVVATHDPSLMDRFTNIRRIKLHYGELVDEEETGETKKDGDQKIIPDTTTDPETAAIRKKSKADTTEKPGLIDPQTARDRAPNQE